MPLLTLFTTPKPFVNPHITMIQRNTLKNWLKLGDDIEVVVIGDDPGIAEVCERFGLHHLPDVKTSPQGIPLISSIFSRARDVNNSPFLVYANADILFLPALVDSVRAIAEEKPRFLGVGQRYDLDVNAPMDFAGDWADELRERALTEGELHAQTGSDYFIFPRTCFQEIPDFMVGRAGWDNWMIFKARWEHWSVVDMTPMLTIIHQNHDYAHLAGGIKHYHQPETWVNVYLGGGRRTIFELTDATHTLRDGKLEKKPCHWKRFWREVEIFPLIGLHSKLLGWLSFAVFHPIKAFMEIRGWLMYKINALKKKQELRIQE